MAEQSQTKAVRVRISGRVQGVFFRAWTVEEATRRNLDGWVRNCRDGTVEAVFSGPVAEVEEMVAACRKGPPAAVVTGLEQAPVEAIALGVPAGLGFRALPTA